MSSGKDEIWPSVDVTLNLADSLVGKLVTKIIFNKYLIFWCRG